MNENKISSINKMNDVEFYYKQDECFKSNDVSETYIAKDTNDTGSKMYAPVSFSILEEITNTDQNVYEIIKEDRPRKFYIDYDCKFADIKDWAFNRWDKIDGGIIKDDISGSIEEVMTEFLHHYKFNPINGDDFAVNILDASDGLKKFSFHIVCDDVILKDQKDSKIFHEKFLKFADRYFKEQCWETYGNLNEFFDRGVYTKNRVMRCLGQSKFGQDRPLKILSGSKDIKDHFITYTEKNKTFFDVPISWRPRKITNPTNKVKGDFNENDELILLVENTLHKTIDYTEWRNWVWACCGAGVPPTKIHFYSMDGGGDYDEVVCDRLIAQYDSEKTKAGKHTLKKWAAENGYELERNFEVKPLLLSEIKEDHITWLDILRKYHNKTFEDFWSMIETIREDVSMVVSMIQGVETLFTIYANDDTPFGLTKILPKLSLKYFVGGDDGKLMDTTLQKVMIDYPLEFPCFNKLVFKPDNHNVKTNDRNMWLGFEAEKVKDEVDMSLIAPILQHIREVIASSNQEWFEYIMTWLAQVIQTPWKPTDIFLLLQGKQGSGKTATGNFLIDYVFGKHLSLSTNGISGITQKHNSSCMSKIFVCCNELTTLDSGSSSFNGAFDKLKNLITDRMIEVEPKCKERIQIQNYANFMGTTNHNFTAKIEKGDRRYACFSVSSHRVGDYDYFDNLHKHFTKEVGDHFFTYLKQYPIKINLRKIPMTELKSSMISHNPIERFIIDCINQDEITDKSGEIIETTETERTAHSLLLDRDITVRDTYSNIIIHYDISKKFKKFSENCAWECYKEWSKDSNERNTFNKTTFKKSLKPYIIRGKDRQNDSGKQKRFLSFNYDVVNELLQNK